ncbi:MAG: hypothetical protein FVQ81_11525 [Candidatus Glassbacteria bacterium]|nr:hypothetical protein [Candidatus Glassbacteria bacterium]
MTDEGKELIRAPTKVETALDIASLVGSAVPWIGGPVSNVLSGMSFGRKLGRVREVLEGVAADLAEFKSEVSEEYVRTEEFEDLLEQALRRASEERSEEKRRMYRAFLSDAIEAPGESYDDQLRLLRTFEELQPDHLRVLKIMSQEPGSDPGMMGSPIQTLRERLLEFDDARIEDLVAQLNDMWITNLGSLKVMMTGRGAADLRHVVTEYGQRLLRYILET